MDGCNAEARGSSGSDENESGSIAAGLNSALDVRISCHSSLAILDLNHLTSPATKTFLTDAPIS
jgi:hypothetical protein